MVVLMVRFAAKKPRAAAYAYVRGSSGAGESLSAGAEDILQERPVDPWSCQELSFWNDASHFGHQSVYVAITSRPPLARMKVSSAFAPPSKDGFQAKAMPASISSCVSGVAIISRGAYPVRPP